MKKLLPIICTFIGVLVFSQSLIDFIPDQYNPYNEGFAKFYKDLNEQLVSNNLKTCEDKNEHFVANIHINSNNQAEIKSINPNSNGKCAKELFLSGLTDLNKLNNWSLKIVPEFNMATTDFEVIFYPSDFFGNFKENYTLLNSQIPAQYLGGINEFRELFAKNFQYPKKKLVGNLKYKVTFDIDTDGSMINIKIKSDTPDSDIDESILQTLKKIDNKKWIPGTIKNIPYKTRVRLPVSL